MAGPGVGEVWLYKDTKYGGFVWKFTESKQNFDDYGCNDKASSIRVGPGTTAMLYKDAGFKGSYMEFNVDTSSLGDMNDKSSSLQILKEPSVAPPTPGPGEVYLYRECNFEGFVWRIKADCADTNQLGAKGKISSVRIGPGNEVLLYDQPGFKGQVVTLGGNVASLPKSHNDKVASVKIMRK